LIKDLCYNHGMLFSFQDKISPKEFLKTLPHKPGVYQMFNAAGEIIYVGKAKDLKKRVSSYFRKNLPEVKTRALMREAQRIEVTITANENEALLLENNFIKEHRPRYNIFFKDDKSFPYLFLSQHSFPRLLIYRGAKDVAGTYFGPYPTAQAVYETLHLAQKVFLIRSCNDNFFSHRIRPCLQYQIKRCSAPCVGFISAEDYKRNIDLLKQLLRGKNQLVVKEIREKMRAASLRQEFEVAARFRDQLLALEKIQMPQRVIKDRGDLDVLAVVSQYDKFCLQILSVRGGAVIASKFYFPVAPNFITAAEILSTFLEQRYLDFIDRDNLPQKILVNTPLSDRAHLQNLIGEKLQVKLNIIDKTQVVLYRNWLQLANNNAAEALQRHFLLHPKLTGQFKALQELLKLENSVVRIECFDISHGAGKETVGVSVVFSALGPEKNDYRKYNINDVKASDDYAAMAEAVSRHYASYLEQKKKLPEVILIDGGRGQLHVAAVALRKLKVAGVTLLAIAKDHEGKKDADLIYRFFENGDQLLNCPLEVLHLLQRIRDETHRFAITSHRKKHARVHTTSILQDIPGIGPKKRAVLLQAFSGLQNLQTASVEEIAKVPGINQELAQKIYDYLHGQK
jgi:excinuclease ABC subunit C